MNSKKDDKKKILLGVTGASGSVYAKMLMEQLSKRDEIQLDVIFSKTAKEVWKYELDNADFMGYPFRFFEHDDLFAAPASGSANYQAMIIIPCSMGTLGRIASGISNDLMTRAADVMLKERRKLILATREAPLSKIHIENMLRVTEAGGIICPASPGFYHKPNNIESLLQNTIDRVLSLADIDADGFEWV